MQAIQPNHIKFRTCSALAPMWTSPINENDELTQLIQYSENHCKDKIPKFRNKYSQKRNIGVSVPISTFMRLWAIYIFPQSICLFCWRKYVDRSWDYINRSQTHECWNWGWGRAIPRNGIHKWSFRCSAGYLRSGTRAQASIWCWTMGRPATGNSGFGMFSDSGRNRVPFSGPVGREHK